MISSTPIILRELRRTIDRSWRDVVPVAAVIVDYGALVVRIDSPFQSWRDVLDAFEANPRSINVAGGSAMGSTDHLVAALAVQVSGHDPRTLKYIPYNAGGQAMVGLLSRECQLLSTGLSEALALAEQGEVRILAVTAPERLERVPQVATFVEQGFEVVFMNWRGFFGPPGLDDARQRAWHALFARMYATAEWQRVRDLYGWSDFFVSGAAFATFLEGQERQIARLARDLGFLAP